MKKLAPSIFLLYLVLLTLFTTLMIVVHMIPRSAIEPQFQRSVEIFTRKVNFP